MPWIGTLSAVMAGACAVEVPSLCGPWPWAFFPVSRRARFRGCFPGGVLISALECRFVTRHIQLRARGCEFRRRGTGWCVLGAWGSISVFGVLIGCCSLFLRCTFCQCLFIYIQMSILFILVNVLLFTVEAVGWGIARRWVPYVRPFCWVECCSFVGWYLLV